MNHVPNFHPLCHIGHREIVHHHVFLEAGHRVDQSHNSPHPRGAELPGHSTLPGDRPRPDYPLQVCRFMQFLYTRHSRCR
jgi:hypothetical protein